MVNRAGNLCRYIYRGREKRFANFAKLQPGRKAKQGQDQPFFGSVERHGSMLIRLSNHELVSSFHQECDADRYRAQTDGLDGKEGRKDARGSPPPPVGRREGGSRGSGGVDGLDKVAHVEPLWAP